MKLLYKNIVVGSLRDLRCDMYRESGQIDLLPIKQRESTELSRQLFEWVENISRLEELDLVLNDEEYDDSREVKKLWERRSRLPDFGSHDCWKLLYDETGKVENISSPQFCGSSVGWYLNPPEMEKKDDHNGDPQSHC